MESSSHAADSPAGRYPAAHLRGFAAEVFARCGVPEGDARQAADVLCTADEWGISSHGVARLKAYYEMLALGRINARASVRVVRETPSVALVDGDNGLGLVVGARANLLAIEKAQETGTAWVGVRHSNHFGIAGYYAVQGVPRDMICWAMTNTPALVSPLWGVGRVLGTNPLSVAIPAHREPPVVVDMATSAVSFGVAENAARRGEQLPTGCIADASGNQSTEPADLFAGGSLLPLGGDRQHGGHKGYCLAALIDLLCGVLSGANWGPFIPPFPHALGAPRPQVGLGLGHLFGAFSIGAFTESEEFKKGVDDWVELLRSTAPAPGTDGVQIPGDPERRAASESAARGVFLLPSVVEELEDVARRLGITFENF